MPEFRRCCPTCGLEVQATVSTCPRDGTTIDNPFQTDPTFQQKYEFLESIGAGGMGVIYKARHLILNKIIAIKMVHSHLATEQAIQRFQVEGKAAASLHHPYIIGVQDLGTTTSGQPYMVLDFLNGKTLSQVLASEGHLDHKRFLRLFLQVTDALVHAHTRGVLHRDIKPANIMIVKGLDGEEEVRILDFGLAKIVDEAEAARHLTKTGVAMGSPLYMSPEQAQGAKVDERSDIYSLGCTMFEALTGTPPFEGNTPFETMLKHLNDAPPTLTSASLGQEFDPRLQYVMDRMLEKSLKCRYQSMQEVRDDLLKIQRNEPLIAASLPPPPKSNKPLIIGIACASAIAAGLLFFFLSPGLLHHDSKSNAAAAIVAPTAPPAATPGTQNAPVIPVSDESKPKTEDLSSSPIPKIDQKGDKFVKDGVENGTLPTSISLSGKNFLLLGGENFTDKGLQYLQRGHIVSLDVKGSSITDEGMRYLAKLPLVKLDVSDTEISDKGLEQLPQNLQILVLDHTKVTDASAPMFSLLKKLYCLSLEYDNVSSAVLRDLAQCPNLQGISLRYTKVDDKGVSGLVNSLPYLKELYLSGDDLSEDALSSICKLKYLAALDMTQTHIDGRDLRSLSQLKNLRYLDLSSAGLADFGEWHSLPALSTLLLAGNNRIADKSASSIAKLKNLRYLDLSGTSVRDTGLLKLTQCKSLEQVCVKDSKVSPVGITKFHALAPNIRVVNKMPRVQNLDPSES